MKNSIPKNRILLRGAALALALCLLFSCASCGKKNTATALRADLSGRVYTLDPQYCSTALERCLLKNCMEGLLRRLPDGTMAEGCAENYSVSADGLRYTFTLRENLQWSDGDPLTAKDFVFAFQRIQQGSGSAAAREQFAAIAGMAAGRAAAWALPRRMTAPSLSPFPAPIPCCRKSWQSRRPSLAGRTSTPAPTPATAILSRI